MAKKLVAVVLTVVGLSVGGVGGVAEAGAADSSVRGLWSRLDRLDATYLRDWRSVNDRRDRSADAALDAFREVAYQVSAPGGLWRSEVANTWFGCRLFEASPACQALTAARPELERWDRVIHHTLRLGPAAARRYLRRNARRLIAYLDRYVPRSQGMKAAMATPFYRERLAAVADRMPLNEPLDDSASYTAGGERPSPRADHAGPPRRLASGGRGGVL